MARRRITVICPQCGGSRTLLPHDARKAQERGSVCQRCHLSKIAPLGYMATCNKYGEKFAVECLRLHLLKNPSALERRVIRGLKALDLTNEGFTVERESTLVTLTDAGAEKWYLVDFVISKGDTRYAIEVNGAYVHSHHMHRDAAKTSALIAQGFKVLTLSDDECKSPFLIDTLGVFLGLIQYAEAV